jgi:hypothetical protein
VPRKVVVDAPLTAAAECCIIQTYHPNVNVVSSKYMAIENVLLLNSKHLSCSNVQNKYGNKMN